MVGDANRNQGAEIGDARREGRRPSLTHHPTRLTFGYNDNLGHRYNVPGWSNWSSSNSQVMSVQTAGQPTPGLATAHLSGSTMLSMYDGTPVAVDAGQVCMQGIQPFCPVTTFQDGDPQQFLPDITIIRRVFKDTDNYWKYQVSKLGYTNTVRLP